MQKSTTNFDEKFKVNDLQHEAAGMRGEPALNYVADE